VSFSVLIIAKSLTDLDAVWTGSQIPVYLFGGVPPYIYGDIGGADRWIWLVLANLLSLAAVCPFVGSISDIVGRRWVAMIGACFLILGMIVCSTAQTMNIFICGMVFSGIGAGINELTALAVTSELAPTSQRGKYVAILVFTIIPFCPSVLWAQLIASHSSWRWIGMWCGIWAFIGLALTAIFYHPPPRVNSQGMSRKEILAQIDYIGGFLSVSGMLLFMMGMQWGGYQYPWSSAHVLAPLILGVVLMIAFVFWEIYGAKHPMFPKRLRQEPRILGLTLVITFISGANFFSILMFWPTQAFNVYGHDPVGVGIRGIPVGFSILAGACIVLWLLSMLRGHNKELLIASSILMTAGCGSLAIARVDNLNQLWGLLVLAGLGIGGIVVPASIICESLNHALFMRLSLIISATIICPDDLIATVAALTLAIRVIGGSIGYCVYYNVFIGKSSASGDMRSRFSDADYIHSQVCSSSNSFHWGCDGDEAEYHKPEAYWRSNRDHRRVAPPTLARYSRHQGRSWGLRVGRLRGSACIRRGIQVCLLREYCIWWSEHPRGLFLGRHFQIYGRPRCCCDALIGGFWSST
jgi:MFS family permease